MPMAEGQITTHGKKSVGKVTVTVCSVIHEGYV
jgi:hypothetical protein